MTKLYVFYQEVWRVNMCNNEYKIVESHPHKCYVMMKNVEMEAQRYQYLGSSKFIVKQNCDYVYMYSI